eukprot:1144067-Pelagomonas_calceolata.AAC.1
MVRAEMAEITEAFGKGKGRKGKGCIAEAFKYTSTYMLPQSVRGEWRVRQQVSEYKSKRFSQNAWLLASLTFKFSVLRLTRAHMEAGKRPSVKTLGCRSHGALSFNAH